MALPEVTLPLAGRVTVSECRCRRKVAPTVLSASSVTGQVDAVPEQAPVQPANSCPSAGCAVSVNVFAGVVATSSLASHTVRPPAPQLMPSPLTWPFTGGVTVNSWRAGAKVALTVLSASSVTQHLGAVPEQAPPQRSNSWFAAGAARRMSPLLCGFVSSQSVPLPPQSMPGPVTAPLAGSVTVSARPTLANVAPTVLVPSITILQRGELPVQAPLQPCSSWPVAGVATSSTSSPWSWVAVQPLPQSTPPPAMRPFCGGVTSSWYRFRRNVAPAVLSASIVTWQVRPVPAQAPLQAAISWPVSAVAVNVTRLP